MEHPRQRSRRSRPRRRLLLEPGENRVGEPTRQLRSALAWIGRRLDEVGETDLGRRAPGERGVADEALVDDAAEGVDVALSAGLPSFDQLGSQVVRRAENLAVRGQTRRLGAARKAEVCERRAAVVEEHVRRLHIAVQHSALVQRIEASSDLRCEPARALDVEPSRRAQKRRQ